MALNCWTVAASGDCREPLSAACSMHVTSTPQLTPGGEGRIEEIMRKFRVTQAQETLGKEIIQVSSGRGGGRGGGW